MMNINKEILLITQKIRTLSRNGLVYVDNEYDKERYEELLKLNDRLTALVTNQTEEAIRSTYVLEKEYTTPKVDVRSVIFNEKDEILLVKERADGLWSLPGGWADVGFSPKEVAEKEVEEETGLKVKAGRLLAVMDKKCHNHPPANHYAYKIFILCEIIGGQMREAFDILDKGFFKQDSLPPLSEERVLQTQIDLMFEYKNDPTKAAYVD
ncbi:NUDIX hydrolase N-terminal domain-containing protein [Bacteroidales bacterium OttesenSCG-928-M11]|nr:NUDIX hydrolase N-terminal domain-containing protein [Bacteroidales bacterium OttesenSCG-928-M11]